MSGALPGRFALDTTYEIEVADRDRFLRKLAWETDHGSRPLAEAVTITYLDQYPGDPHAWVAAAQLAWRSGMPAKAIAFLEEALRLDPASEAIAGQLAAARVAAVATAPLSTGTRMMVVKSGGNGFWSDVDHVLGAALLAEIAGREVVVHWGSNSLFGTGADRDHFTDYFAPLSSTTIDDVAAADGPIYPPKWARTTLRRENINRLQGTHSLVTALQLLGADAQTVVSDFHCGVPALLPFLPAHHALAARRAAPQLWLHAYRYLAAKYLRPREEIAAQARRFVQERLADGFVAVHVRGTDKIDEIGAERAELFLREALAVIAERARRETSKRFFVMTDDTDLLARLGELLGERMVCAKATRNTGPEGTHFKWRAAGPALGREVLLDVLIAAQAGSFIGTGASNVSYACFYMRDWPPGAVTMISRPMFMQRPVIFGWDVERLRRLGE